MTPAERITAAVERHGALEPVSQMLFDYRRADLRWQRTHNTSDLLDALIAEDTLADAIERGTGADLSAWREELADEARSTCAYDLIEGHYLDDNGDPRTDRSLPLGYADYRHEMRREA